MNVYFISGLGSDRRVLRKLKFSAAYTIHYIDWIQPLRPESISSYAERLTKEIDTTQPFILAGLSFGGMIAVEMSAFVTPVTTIIISSCACREELPPYFKLAGRLGLHKLVPVVFFKNPNLLFYRLFGTDTAEEKALLDALIRDADPAILKWSIDKILNWQQTGAPQNLWHLHGNRDHILPVGYTKPHIIIDAGKHLMVYSKGDEISAVLQRLFDEAKPGISGDNQ